VKLQAMNQGTAHTEKPWFSFTTNLVPWASYTGQNFTDRQRIKRKATSWEKRDPMRCPERGTSRC